MTRRNCNPVQVSRQLISWKIQTGFGTKLPANRTDLRGRLRGAAILCCRLAADCTGYQADMRHSSRLAPDNLVQVGHARHGHPHGTALALAPWKQRKKIRQVPWRKALSKSGLIAVSDKRHRLSLEPAIPGLSRLVFRDAGCQCLPTGAVRDIAPLSRRHGSCRPPLIGAFRGGSLVAFPFLSSVGRNESTARR